MQKFAIGRLGQQICFAKFSPPGFGTKVSLSTQMLIATKKRPVL